MTAHNEIAAITRALQVLAGSPKYKQIRQDIETLAGIDHGGFIGPYSTFNVLVHYARDKGVEALASLWALADRKNEKIYPKNRKNNYQAAYMSQRRTRLNTALRLYERHHSVKLHGDDRDTFRAAMQAAWMIERDELVVGKVPGDERNEIVRQFWERIDAELDSADAGHTDIEQVLRGITI